MEGTAYENNIFPWPSSIIDWQHNVSSTIRPVSREAEFYGNDRAAEGGRKKLWGSSI